MKEKILTFLPVFYVYIVSLLVTLNLTFYYSLQTRISIIYFLGFFSLIFGVLKLIRYRGFIESLLEYDVISQKLKIYAYVYPFFEIIFGVLFILQKEYLLLEYICLGFFFTSFKKMVSTDFLTSNLYILVQSEMFPEIFYLNSFFFLTFLHFRTRPTHSDSGNAK